MTVIYVSNPPRLPLNLLRTSAVNVCSESYRVIEEHIYGQNHKQTSVEYVNVQVKYKDNFFQ